MFITVDLIFQILLIILKTFLIIVWQQVKFIVEVVLILISGFLICLLFKLNGYKCTVRCCMSSVVMKIRSDVFKLRQSTKRDKK